jgi:hypothetical protein
LAIRPQAPADLLGPKLLDSVFERAIENSEAGVVGQLLAAGMPAIEPPISGVPEMVLESPVARALLRPPAQPSPIEWDRVQRSVLADVQTVRPSRGFRSMRLGAAGLAAATIICAFMLSRGTPEETKIVFADLDTMPGVDFAAIRYGATR